MDVVLALVWTVIGMFYVFSGNGDMDHQIAAISCFTCAAVFISRYKKS
jgi:hypothetical protein